MPSVTSDEVMAYFDPSKRSILLVDARPVGLGAVLTQGGKVISYASKALSSVDRRYSQIESARYWQLHGVVITSVCTSWDMVVHLFQYSLSLICCR